jgi:hypothetical protein
MFEKKTVSHDRNTQVFPMLAGAGSGGLNVDYAPSSNWTGPFAQAWLDVTGKDPRNAEYAMDPLPYVYAILHSEAYRSRYYAFLKKDFPRVPVTSDQLLLRVLTNLGAELVALHLLETSSLGPIHSQYVGDMFPRVEKISWSDGTVWLDKARTAGFKGVTAEVWMFYVGGYQVCDKWLKDRKGRVLSPGDIDHYQKVVAALAESLRVMKEIDNVIGRHRGWPDAFETLAHPSTPLTMAAEAREGYGPDVVR